ncbi:nnrU domain protein [Burkholderia pseudomallei MSHR1000]|nr:nnrU domain protein [Burkholderia pseudomallei MSHR1000]
MSPGGEILLSAEPAHAAAVHRTPRAAGVRILRTVALRAPRLRDATLDGTACAAPATGRAADVRRERARDASCACVSIAAGIAHRRLRRMHARVRPCAPAGLRAAIEARLGSRCVMPEVLRSCSSAVPHPRAQHSHARAQRRSSRCVQLRRHAIAHTVHHWTRRSTSRGGVPQPRYALRFARRAPAPARSAARCASRHQSRSMPTSSSTSAGVS